MNSVDLYRRYEKYNDTGVLYRNVSRSGGACAERKACRCRTTFHSLRPLVILYQPELGILQDYRSTSKKLTENNEVYNLVETKRKVKVWFVQCSPPLARPCLLCIQVHHKPIKSGVFCRDILRYQVSDQLWLRHHVHFGTVNDQIRLIIAAEAHD